MLVQQVKLRLAFAVILITGSGFKVFAEENNPEKWNHAFPLSTLKGSTSDSMPDKPDLSRPLSYRETGASAAQVDPLYKTATIRFESSVSTIGDAARLILDPVGYELLSTGPNVSPLLEELLDSPLPVNQREFVHLRVSEMLRALAGVGHVVVVDHVHRKATFDPIPRYKRIGQSTRTDTNTLTSKVKQTDLSRRLREHLIVTSLNEQAVQLEPDKTLRAETQEWQTVGSAITGNDAQPKSRRGAVVEKISLAIDGSERVSALAGISTSGALQEYVVHAQLGATKIEVGTEKALRSIASQFNVDDHNVVISDCSANVSVRSRELHQDLIRSALIRLGVSERHHQNNACPDDGTSVVSNGMITHVVALSLTSS